MMQQFLENTLKINDVLLLLPSISSESTVYGYN